MRADTDIYQEKGKNGKFEVYKLGVNYWRIAEAKALTYLISVVLMLIVVFYKQFMIRRSITANCSQLILKIHSIIFTINSVDLLFYGIRTALHQTANSAFDFGSEHWASYWISRFVLVAFSVEYWALCSCILDDGMWRKYIQRHLLMQDIEPHFSQLVSKTIAKQANVHVNSLGPMTPDNKSSKYNRLRLTAKLEKCFKLMDDSTFFFSYRMVKINQLAAPFKKTNTMLLNARLRVLISADQWRHILLSTVLVSGQDIPYSIAVLLVLYECVKLVVLTINFKIHRHFETNVAFIIEMSQSILMITELVTMCIVSLAPGNHFVLSMACIILIVSVSAIQIILTLYVTIVSIRNQIKDMLRQKKIAKMRQTIEAHLNHPMKQRASLDASIMTTRQPIIHGRFLNRFPANVSMVSSSRLSSRSVASTDARPKAKQQTSRRARHISHSILDKPDLMVTNRVSTKESPFSVAVFPVHHKAGHPYKFINRINNTSRLKL